MIRWLQGTVVAVEGDRVVVAVGPVALEVWVPTSALATLGPPGSPVRLYTSFLVREDRLLLYGFPTEEGRRLFELLLTVRGVGPRTALALAGHLSPQEVGLAIARGDEGVLAKAPGVGKKTASRIVLELKGRLEKEMEAVPGGDFSQQDLLAALLALGYSRREAQEALQAAASSPTLPLEERVRRALLYLGGRGGTA